MRRNLIPIKTSIIKMKYYKISKLLNVSPASKLATKKLIKINDLSSGQHSVNKNIRLKNRTDL